MSLRRYLLALTALLATLVVAPVAMAGGALPQIKDLRSEATLAQQKRVPILLMFGAEYCGYCKRLEADFLKPMNNGGYYNDKVLIRRIDLGESSVIDFDGKRVSVNELAKRYSVSVTPTVIFIDPTGHQLTHKMVGFTTPEFYGSYLDQAIDTSLDRMRRTTPLAVKVSSN